MTSKKIAYFINQYPKVSHSFIRREILALERQGLQIERIALRGWDDELVDPEDLRERSQTRYVLQSGGGALAFALMRVMVTSPGNFLAAFALAVRMSRHADRPLIYHLAYLAEACRILPWLKSFGATHIHAHFGTNSTEVVMLAHALGGPPYSFTVHGPDEFDKPQFLGLGEKIRRAAFVVAISSFGRSQLYRWVEQSHWPKVKIVHCGLEPGFHAVAPQPLPAARRLVCVGRLCEQKGQLLLVEAVAKLVHKGVHLELVLAGDGELRGEIEALIVKYQLMGIVRISGWISGEQVRSEILAARGLVLASFAEGLPVVLMEAMALRRPVLTTYVAGIPELVIAGENGWLFPAGDVDAIATAIADFLSRSDEELQAMGDAAHKRVIERHSIDIEATKLSALLQQTM